MTARAGNGQAQKSFGDHIDAVVEDVAHVAVEMVAERQETERSQRAAVRADVYFVSGDLFDDELVERFVLVERVDDVVAIGPRVRINGTLALAIELSLGVRVARDVEPVAAPAFAVMR